MIKNYVLDTNILLADPQAMFEFEDNTVIIPIGVIEELDRFKKDQSELGKNARQVARTLDKLRDKGDLSKGVKEGEGKIAVRYNGNLKSFYKESNVDLHVLHIAQKTVEQEPNIPCIIVSRDINVRIRANALGLKAQNYESDQVPHFELDQGYSEIILNNEDFERLMENKEIKNSKGLLESEFAPNHYFIIKKQSDENSLLGRMSSNCKKIKRLIPCPHDIGIRAKTREQNFVLDALLDNDIKLVTITGKAGTGKTLLAASVGYFLAVRNKQYKRLLVSRPVFPMGKDIGYLPGDIEEKLQPWMTPIYDAFDVIQGNKLGSGKKMIDGHNIVVEPLTYIRGRSIQNQFLIIDEAQNLSTHEIKTIITRAGENTKVILTGDIYQIDNPYLDSLSNGLSVVSINMKDSQITANIVLDKGVRSQLAEEASNKL